MIFPELPPEDVYATAKKVRFMRDRLAGLREALGRPLRILDFGCGNAVQMGRYLINGTDTYVGVDTHEPSLVYARAHFGGQKARFLDRPPEEEKFDVLVVSEILEHLDDPGRVLAGLVSQHLASGGVVLGSVPNGYGLTEIEKYIDQNLGLYRGLRAGVRSMRALLGRRDRQRTTQAPYNYDSGHVQFFTRSKLRAAAAAAGLALTELRNGSLMGADLSGVTVLRPGFMIRFNTWVADYVPHWAAATWFFRLDRARASRGMDGSKFRVVWRRLAGKTPAEFAALAAGAARRRVRARLETYVDRVIATHGPAPTGERFSVLRAAPRMPTQPQLAALNRMNANSRGHYFDILGSGPVSARYGGRGAGIRDVRFEPGAPVLADAQGEWLAGRVPPAALARSRRIWRLIHDGAYALHAYEPIDWQRDLRSGYRWDARRHWRKIAIGRVRGADIKMPWELARMQHLPRLAYGALAARAAGLEDEAIRDAAEIRAQTLDFIASNPPRFGVNWRSAMEVAIRGANVALALDLLARAGLELDAPARATVEASLQDHANHVLANLEWSEEARGNHYLANITGLLFIAAALPRSRRTDALVAFAAHELDVEIRRQFLADGGSFEGSTGYHRLAGEMALWGCALLVGLAAARGEVFQDFDPSLVRPRPGMPRPPLPQNPAASGAPLKEETLTRLRALAAFAADARQADGGALLIGDDDSGRFFDLQLPEAGDAKPDRRDRAAMLGMADSLFGEVLKTGPDFPLEAQLVRALTGDRPIAAPRGAARVQACGERSLLDLVLARIEAMPAASRRRFIFPWRQGWAPENVKPSAYPVFGLYLLKADGFSLALRCCAPPGPEAAGHTHDDNLALALMMGEDPMVTDPGTFCYTPFPDIRHLYQGIGSHFAPRPEGREAMVYGDGCFHVAHTAQGRCLYFGADGFAGELLGGDWRVLRVVRLVQEGVIVDDGCATGPLAPYSILTANHKVCRGYGEEAGYTPYAL